MKVVISKDVLENARKSKRTFGSVGYFVELQRLAEEGPQEVETEHLFENQFNLKTLRVMEEDVIEVIDDIRDDYYKCGCCGKQWLKKDSETCPEEHDLSFRVSLMSHKTRHVLEKEAYLARGYDWRGNSFAYIPGDVMSDLTEEQKKRINIGLASASELFCHMNRGTCERANYPDGTPTNYRAYRMDNGRSFILGDKDDDMPGIWMFIKYEGEKFPAIEVTA